MHTTREMLPALNEQVSVRFESIRVDCIVDDVKSAYGKVRLLVIPVSGGGSQWVELDRVQRQMPLSPDHVAAIDNQTNAFVQARMTGRPVSFRYVDGTHETFNA